MYMSEMMEVHNKLKSLHSEILILILILIPITNIDTICDGEDIDVATLAVFNTVLNWMKENIEDIKFK